LQGHAAPYADDQAHTDRSAAKRRQVRFKHPNQGNTMNWQAHV